MADILQGGPRDKVYTDVNGALPVFAVTNFVQRFTHDANDATLANVNDTIGTLIRELIRAGIINGTVTP